MLDEVPVKEIGQHPHGPLADLVKIDIEASEGGTGDAGVFGSNKGEDLDIRWDGKPGVGRGVHDGRGDGIAIANWF